MNELVNDVVELFSQAIEGSGEQWISAVVPFEISGTSTAAAVAYYTRPNGERAGLRLERVRSFELADQLTTELSDSTGTKISRVRVTIRPDMSASVEHFGPRPVPGNLQHFGVWPDEAGYDGPVVDLQPAEASRRVDASYRQVALVDIAPVVDSLGRIDAWLGSHAGELAGLLNSPASVDRVASVEESLGVRFPASVREAYLIHDGQQGSDGRSRVFHLMGWRSLDAVVEAADELKKMARGDTDTMIPVLTVDGGHVYVRSVTDGDDESELVEWAAGDNQDFLRADSFGAFLEQFADELEAGKFVFHDGQLHEVEQLEEIDDDEYFDD